MVKGSLAKRYARAFMALGQELGVSDRIGTELNLLSELTRQSEPLRLAIKTPMYSKEERAIILELVAKKTGLHELTLRCLKLLNEKGRLASLEAIAASFRELSDEAQGRVRASVISAAPLTSQGQNSLRDALAALTHKTVLMDQAVDPDLIGGVITRVAGLLLDGSVRTQLKIMEEKLKQVGGAGV